MYVISNVVDEPGCASHKGAREIFDRLVNDNFPQADRTYGILEDANSHGDELLPRETIKAITPRVREYTIFKRQCDTEDEFLTHVLNEVQIMDCRIMSVHMNGQYIDDEYSFVSITIKYQNFE